MIAESPIWWNEPFRGLNHECTATWATRQALRPYLAPEVINAAVPRGLVSWGRSGSGFLGESIVGGPCRPVARASPPLSGAAAGIHRTEQGLNRHVGTGQGQPPNQGPGPECPWPDRREGGLKAPGASQHGGSPTSLKQPQSQTRPGRHLPGPIPHRRPRQRPWKAPVARSRLSDQGRGP